MTSTLVESWTCDKFTSLATIIESKDPEVDLLSDHDVAMIVERKTGEKDIPISSWKLEPHPMLNGFMGSYYHLTIIINHHGIAETLILFAKTPPKPGPQQDFMTRNGLFTKEIKMYDEIIPELKNGDASKWFVDCYLCKKDVIMVMEDLGRQNYDTINKYRSFNYDELACLFSTFAKFHSRSLILDERLRVQGKSILDLWGDELKEGLYTNEETSLNYQRSGLIGLQTMANNIKELREDQRRYILNKVNKWWKQPIKAFEPSEKYRNVICHRDVWSSNFMFKMDSNGKPVNCRLIDFQYYSYINPAMDIILAMHMCASRETREKHYEALMKLYHNCLTRCLKDEGLDVDELLPWQSFIESCEDARPWALIYVLLNQQVTLLNHEAAEKYFAQSPELLKHVLYGPGRAELVNEQFNNVPAYRDKLTESILEILEVLPDKPKNY